MSQPISIPRRQGLHAVPTAELSEAALHAKNIELEQLRLRASGPAGAALRGPVDEACATRETRIVAAADGRIEHLLLTVPRYESSEGGPVVAPWHRDHLCSIVRQLGGSVRFTTVCRAEQKEEVTGWFRDLGIDPAQVDLVLSKYDYTIWAQDAHLALEIDGGRPALCEGVQLRRNDDMVMADDVAAQTDVALLHSILEFQGGNVLGGTEVHLVGRDFIEWNVGRRRLETPELVVEEFELLLGGKVLMIGLDEAIPSSDRRGAVTGDWQPIFHIDMYITRTGVLRDGREVVLVGSPRLARSLLGEAERPSDQDPYFDQAVRQLEQLGFAVDLLPLLPTKGSPCGWPEQAYVLTWNNAIVEHYRDESGDEIRRVLLPVYADPANPLAVDQGPRELLDAAATKVWEDLGFEVLPTNPMEDLAYSSGAVHCISKVLKRGSAPAP